VTSVDEERLHGPLEF